ESLSLFACHTSRSDANKRASQEKTSTASDSTRARRAPWLPTPTPTLPSRPRSMTEQEKKLALADYENNWQSVMDDFITEQARASENQDRFPALLWPTLREQLQIDLDFADAISDEYKVMLAQMLSEIEKPPTTGQVRLDRTKAKNRRTVFIA